MTVARLWGPDNELPTKLIAFCRSESIKQNALVPGAFMAGCWNSQVVAVWPVKHRCRWLIAGLFCAATLLAAPVGPATTTPTRVPSPP